jgi:putative nucleotidyltransferase with HDIG domain
LILEGKGRITMESRNILKELEQIENLPTLPSVVMEVNGLLENLDTSINTLSRTVEKDQVIVSKILKLVNSAFFGLSSKIGSIPHALVLLGFNTIRNAVVSLSVIQSFSEKRSPAGFDAKDLWTHSIAVAVISKHLAIASRLSLPDEAFVSGLLHDIGKLILWQFFPEDFMNIWEQVREQKAAFCEAEKRQIGVGHARIGSHLAERWKLPPDIVFTIRNHHASSERVNQSPLLLLIHSADSFINAMGSPTQRGGCPSGSSAETGTALEPILNQADQWFPKVSDEIESACRFFLRN